MVLALREVTSGLDNVQDMLLYCSFCNSDFTMAVLKNIMVSPGAHIVGSSGILLEFFYIYVLYRSNAILSLLFHDELLFRKTVLLFCL